MTTAPIAFQKKKCIIGTECSVCVSDHCSNLWEVGVNMFTPERRSKRGFFFPLKGHSQTYNLVHVHGQCWLGRAIVRVKFAFVVRTATGAVFRKDLWRGILTLHCMPSCWTNVSPTLKSLFLIFQLLHHETGIWICKDRDHIFYAPTTII